MLSASLCSCLRYNVFQVKRNSDHMVTKLDFNSDYKLSKDCDYALHGPLWAGKIQGLHALQWTWLPACLSAPSCNVGTRSLGNDFTGQITYSYKTRLQLKSVWQPQHYRYALLVQAGLTTRWLQTTCCAFAAEVFTRERCNLPRGCSALQLHLTSSHHLPANLSGRFYNAGRKQKSARHIGWMLCLHPEKLSQKPLTPLHVSLYISGPEPQCSLISLSVHKAKYH